jgi:hypothetical protein
MTTTTIDKKPKAKDDVLREKLARVTQHLKYSDVVLADGFDGALIGIATQGKRPVAVYDYSTCIKMLANNYLDQAAAQKREGYAEGDALLEAMQFIDHNENGAGENAPVYLRFTRELVSTLFDDLNA